MNEAEYFECRNPTTLLNYAGFVNDRKLRLWVFAMCAQAHSLDYARKHYAKWEDGESGGIDDEDALVVAVSRDWSLFPSEGIDALEQCNLFREVVGNPFRPVSLPESVRGEPTVRELALAAYEQRRRICGRCKGRLGRWGRGEFDAEWKSCSACGGEGLIDNGTLDPARLAVLSDALEEAGCPADEPCRRCYGRGMVADPPGMEALLDAEAESGALTLSGAWTRCHMCNGSGRTPHPILDHLRIAPSTDHVRRCGTEFRGCAPECPKDRWERNGPHVRGCWALDLILSKE